MKHPSLSRVARLALLVQALAGAACTGFIDGPRGPDEGSSLGTDNGGAGADPGAIAGGGAAGGAGASDPNGAGILPLRRLTRGEYDHVVHDLLGTDATPSSAFPSEPTGESGFVTPGRMADVDTTLYERAAGTLASEAVQKLESLAPCTAAANDEAARTDCVRQLVRDFGLRAYRRPLAADELDAHVALYTAARSGALGYDFAGGVRVLLSAMLQSPDFLYHWEAEPRPLSPENGVVRLDGYQLASRLSFFLWQSMPDALLFEAAAKGELATPAQIEQQVRRMLADPRAQASVAAFFPQWLQLDTLEGAQRDPASYPDFNDKLARTMKAELIALAKHLVLDQGERVDALFTSTAAFVDEGLARVYGVAGVKGDALVLRELDARTRAGLLTRAGVLAVGANAYEGDPTKRGKLVREQVLCQALPSPPPGLPPLPEPGEQTIRQRHEQHVADASCNGCHRAMDPIGFGFGNFDAIGRHVSSELGQAIDSRGQVTSLDGVDQSFDDVAGLSALLSQSEDVRRCFMRQWLRYGLGRKESAADGASLDSVWEHFASHEFEMRELLVAVASSRSFLYRAVADGEPAP